MKLTVSTDVKQLEPSIDSVDSLQSQPVKKSELTGPQVTIESHGCVKRTVTATSSEGHNYCLTFHCIKKPDIKVYRDQIGGELAAVAYIHSWHRVYNIGVGHDASSLEWVKSKTKVYPKRPTFEWRGQTYILSRVSVDENGEKLEKPRWRWYFGVKDGAGRWVALLSPNGRGRQVMKLAEGVGEGLWLVIMLAICSWQEEMRRAG